MKLTLLFSAGVSLIAQTSALGQASPVTTESSSSLLKLSGVNGQILLSSDEWWGVLRAAQDLAGDFGKVTGKNLTLGNWDGGVKSNLTTRRGVEGRQVVNASANSWESVHQAPPKSSEHEFVATDGKGTTVYYKFQPVSNNVNVSRSLATTENTYLHYDERT